MEPAERIEIIQALLSLSMVVSKLVDLVPETAERNALHVELAASFGSVGKLLKMGGPKDATNG